MEGQPSSPTTKEREIFLAARDQPSPEARAACLDRACGQDLALRAAVEALLRHHQNDNQTIISTKVLERSDSPTEKAGDVIGRYKLLEKIAEGGFGAVYVAEQKQPLRRQVALKIIKLGMDTKQVVARFEAERQALAMMDHPNIAKVLDAGATDTGRPYFVMELVRGIAITDYCDQHQLSTRQRLDLFILVCYAVQHAHQKGIIHRDLKPSNILVTSHDGVPVPKVIDFGIAKATQGSQIDNTAYTEFRQFVGTPAYMSPEQAEMSGMDIDTRTDIYSLGVLLYQLLTSQTPFDIGDLQAAGLEEICRTIREREPLHPSTRLRSLPGDLLAATAQQHATEPLRLLKLVHGDLDWVVMKCLEKDRTRRYESASALAVDVQRHLDNEPVLARPPSKLYRFQKFVRRNKLQLTAVAGVAAALVFGLVIATLAVIRERKAEQEAKVDAARAEMAEAGRTNLLKVAKDYEATEEQYRMAMVRALEARRANKPDEELKQAELALAARPGDPLVNNFIQEAKMRARRAARSFPGSSVLRGVVILSKLEELNAPGVSEMTGVSIHGPEFLKLDAPSFRKMVSYFIGKPFSKEDLGLLQTNIALYCSRAGHPNVDVDYPAQAMTNGVIQIAVLEGAQRPMTAAALEPGEHVVRSDSAPTLEVLPPVVTPPPFTNSLPVPPGAFPMSFVWLPDLPGTENSTWQPPGAREAFHGGGWVARYKVTQEQFEQVLGFNPSEHKDHHGDRFPNRPVENMTFAQAAQFCAKLTAMDQEARKIPLDWRYTIPSVKQWAFYAAGTPLNIAYAHYAHQRAEPVALGLLSPNFHGLYDALGDVYELTRDAIKLDDGVNGHIRRGGSYRSNKMNLSTDPDASVEAVGGGYPDAPNSILGPETGFRVILVPDAAAR